MNRSRERMLGCLSRCGLTAALAASVLLTACSSRRPITVKPTPSFVFRSLDLSHNNFAGLPDIFLELINLTCLCVNDNRLSSLPEGMRSLKGLQELDLRNNQLKRLDVVRELPRLRKLLVEGNPLTREEIRSLFKLVDRTTRKIFVDIAGSVTCQYGNKAFAYSSTMLPWS